MACQPGLQRQRVDGRRHLQGGTVERDPLAAEVQVQQVLDGGLEVREAPASGLLRQLLGAERLELQLLDDLWRTRARIEMLAHEQQVADPAVQLRDEHRHRYGLADEPLGQCA